jgi:hypothetical protein
MRNFYNGINNLDANCDARLNQKTFQIKHLAMVLKVLSQENPRVFTKALSLVTLIAATRCP